jgi:excisionase family DNA binding protein
MSCLSLAFYGPKYAGGLHRLQENIGTLPKKEKELLKEPIQQEWVSYPEAERYSGLSHTTLWRYVTSGDLKAARIGRSVRIHLPSLREFMEQASAS